MKTLGILALLIGSVFTFIFFWFMSILTSKIFDRIEKMHNQILASVQNDHGFEDLTSMILFLGIRTLVFGVVGGFVLFFLFKFAKSCFDQSTRFLKRKHATEFLEYISYREDKLEEQMKAFYIWNLTVESAFTSKSIESKRPFGDLCGIFGAEVSKEGTAGTVQM